MICQKYDYETGIGITVGISPRDKELTFNITEFKQYLIFTLSLIYVYNEILKSYLVRLDAEIAGDKALS